MAAAGLSSLNPVYSNILVIRKIPAALRTSSALEAWIVREAGDASEGAGVLRWHDEETAIVSFCEPAAASAALPTLSGAGRLGERFRETHEAAHPLGALPRLSAAVAATGVVACGGRGGGGVNGSGAVATRLRAEAAMPSPLAPVAARPPSDTSVASRLIRGALGAQRHMLGGRAPPSDPASTGAGYLRPVAPLPERGAAALASWRTNAVTAAPVNNCAPAATAEVEIPTPTRPAARGRGAAASDSAWRAADSTPTRGGGGGDGWEMEGGGSAFVSVLSTTDALWRASRLPVAPTPLQTLTNPSPSPAKERRPLTLNSATAATFSPESQFADKYGSGAAVQVVLPPSAAVFVPSWLS